MGPCPICSVPLLRTHRTLIERASPVAMDGVRGLGEDQHAATHRLEEVEMGRYRREFLLRGPPQI